jgi:D-alanyl-D-alanine dipeptidase
MGTPFDTFSESAHTANATGVAAENRQKLKAAMEKRGFLNYDQEWWHYTFNVSDPLRFDRVIR